METQFVPKEQGNKTIAMMKTFNVIIEKDNAGFYVASVPELKGCHTQAKSLDILLDRIKEAIALCSAVDDSAISNQFVGFQRISVSV